jgi:transcriptional regulator with XRE-family HTH domain
MPLADKIKQLREEREWTQEELALRSGIAQTTIASIEAGKAKNPTTPNLLKLARAFNIRPEELYQAAGYISDARTAYKYKEPPEDALERAVIALPESVPVYGELVLHADSPGEIIDYVQVSKKRARGKKLEGYIAHGKCLEPDIQSGDTIIIDRDGEVDSGNIVAYLFDNELHLARLRRIARGLYLENNERRIKLQAVQLVAPVVEVRRKLR